MNESKKQRRGFACMDPARQREIASRGGKAVHAQGKAHKFTREEAVAAGVKGGIATSSKPGWMKEIGQRSGRLIASRPGHMAAIGRLGGFAKQAAAR